jgi:hypothetical protein
LDAHPLLKETPNRGRRLGLGMGSSPDMAFKFLRIGVVFLALSAPAAVGAQQSDLRPCPPGTHSETYPNGNGYWCVANRW